MGKNYLTPAVSSVENTQQAKWLWISNVPTCNTNQNGPTTFWNRWWSLWESIDHALIVTRATEGEILFMKEERPDLVLLDLTLPEGDEIEVVKDILGPTDVPITFPPAYGRGEFIAEI